jgi:hypothetical protein
VLQIECLRARSDWRKIKYSAIEAPGDLIVGVVGDVKITGLDQAIKPVLYYPFRQNASIFSNLVVRTNSDTTTLANTVRNEIRSIEPEAAILNINTMNEGDCSDSCVVHAQVSRAGN